MSEHVVNWLHKCQDPVTGKWTVSGPWYCHDCGRMWDDLDDVFAWHERLDVNA